ncbi:CHAP domain-containing protein [Salinactinospora qingdaonensis]|uniref:CHAP domain-containing protein n=1 Tax=Salinactinospora qingdaonensis TaxID=702744 RepID=A0ABP7G4B9_9ACTN
MTKKRLPSLPLRSLAVVATLLLSIVGLATPAYAAQQPYGTTIVSAGEWLSAVGGGVDVYSNGSAGYVSGDYSAPAVGMKWQCVELPQRLYQAKGWHGGIFAGVSGAYQIYDAAPNLGMERWANGSISSVVPGDMIVHGTGVGYGYGHVSVVDNVDGSTIEAVEQNASYSGRASYTLSGGSLSRAGVGDIRGVVHDPDNPATVGSGSPGGRNVGLYAVPRGPQLVAGQQLHSDEYLVSDNGHSVLKMQPDGNLVLYGPGFQVKWKTSTEGNPGSYLGVQGDGNVVLYRPDGTPLWATNTSDITRFVVQSDGNLVGYDNGGNAEWASDTVDSPDYSHSGHRLVTGQQLHAGSYLRSQDRRYYVLMQADGNLVVYSPGYRVLWASNTDGQGSRNTFLGVQSDGNVVVYRENHGPALWATNPRGITRFVIQDDGNLVGYDSSDNATWATGTDGMI